MSEGPSVPRFAYVTQYDSNNGIVVCVVDPINGLLSSCGDVGGHDVLDGIFPQAISINSAGTIAYITANNDLPYAYQCTIDRTNGTFSACSAINITTPSNYDTQLGMLTLNASNTMAFIANSDTTASILACPIINGSISQTCSNTGATLPVNATPVGIVLNSTNTISYFGNYVVNNVTQCIVNGSGFSSCSNKTGDGIINFSFPAGVALTSNGNILYIADSSTPNVYGCETTPNGPSEFSHCFIATALSFAPWGITLNAQGTIAYVTGYGNTVSVCPMLPDGTFPTCTGITGFSSAIDVSLLY